MSKLCMRRSHWRFEDGYPVKCTLDKDHDGDHFNSFAMRSWKNDKKVRQTS